MADLKIIHCTIDPVLAHERLIRRNLQARDTDATHRASIGATELGSTATQAFEALSLELPSLTVLTAEGYEPPLEDILAFVRSDNSRLGT